MADKIYEAGTPIASGIYPKGDFFLVNAEDVQVGEKKSLAEHIAEGGGGSSLPDYTDADNGKFLRLVDGEPTWVLIPNAEEVSF